MPELDLGQLGGTRQLAGDALFSGHVIPGGDITADVDHKLPQQNLVFRDRLGYFGGLFRIEGILRAKTAVIFETILGEIDQRKHGSLRDGPGGALLPPVLSMLKETQLTDSAGVVLAVSSVVDGWRATGRKMRDGKGVWAVMMPLTIAIRRVG